MYIYKAAVVGAGKMGAEIAQLISYSGLPVILKDVRQDLVDQGLAKIREIYMRRVEKGKMSESDAHAKLALVSGATDFSGFKDADIIIEAVPEDMELKKKVFSELEKVCSEFAILASNTSSLSISEIGSATTRPEKVIGLHFFFPAHVMKLVEVIPGLATSQDTIDDTMGFAESCRKIPVRVNECSGFLVNRLLMPYLNEAAYCLEEGAATVMDIDQAMVDFGFPMGPFTLVDNLCLDLCREVAEILCANYGDRMKPAPLWKAFYEAGLLGVKKGEGFYDYGESKGRGNCVIQDLQSRYRGPKKTFSSERLLIQMINEAAHCVQENVSKASDIDIAVQAGLGFPQDKGGILAYADRIGLDYVLERLTEYSRAYGERFWPCPLIRRMVGAKFLGVKNKRGFFEYTA